MKLSSCVFLALCLLLVQGQQIAKDKCIEYRSLTITEESIVFISRNPQVVHHESSKCDKTVDLIVGGVNAKPGEFPHQALLGWARSDDGTKYAFSCGGSLISERFVLTAAHCLNKGAPEIVRLGVNNLANESEDYLEYSVAAAMRHPKYRSNSSYNDIGLVKLEESVGFTDTIRPACLWTESEVNETSVIATGFGITENAGLYSNILQKVSLNILTKVDCAQFNESDRKFNRGIAEEQLCIGSLEEKKDTCSGDSGGPVQVLWDTDECVYHILGVTSIGTACGIGKSSAIYTFVAPYVKWIEGEVWK